MVEPSELDAILGALLVPDNEQIRHVDLRLADPLDKKNHAFTEVTSCMHIELMLQYLQAS